MTFNLKNIGRYEVKVTCENCGKDCTVKIKKGVTVPSAIKSKTIRCDNCGCTMIPEEYKTQWLE